MTHHVTAIIQDKKGRTISIGRNSYTKTHPLQARAAKATGSPHRIYLHAEVAAIVRLKDWNRGYRLIVTRFDSLGNPVCAKPCPSCQHVIKLAGITRIEHT